jgi:hypothetical protein
MGVASIAILIRTTDAAFLAAADAAGRTSFSLRHSDREHHGK